MALTTAVGARIQAWGETLAAMLLPKPSPVPIRVEKAQSTDHPAAGAEDGGGHVGIGREMHRPMWAILGVGSATLWLVLLEVTDFSAVTVGLGLLVAIAIIS